MIRQPLEAVGYESRMDVSPACTEAASPAQAASLRHGISRALIVADPNLRGELKRRGFLTRDPRVKERKKAGLKKARKRPQFSKRWPPLDAAAAFRHRRYPGSRRRFPERGARARAGRARRSRGPPEPRPQVLIVRDTRESGEMLESAIAAGVTASGGDASSPGCCPHPPRPCSYAVTASTWPR